MPLIERTFVSADGTPIFAEAAGDHSKPTIVFLHGLSSTGLAWDKVFCDPALLRDFHLVRYDMRGHGRSGKPFEPERYESARFAEDFKAVSDGFGFTKPFLAGWSIGGVVAVDIVAAYGAEALSGVLYVGGGALAIQKYYPQCASPFLGEKLVPLVLSTDADTISRAADAFVDTCIAPANPLSYRERLQWMGAFASQPRTVRLNSVSRMQPYELWEQRARGLPVLIVQGTEDQHCLYENQIRLAKGVYDEVEVKLLEGCGHTPAVERAPETSAYIHDWVTRISARQTN